MSRAGYSFRYTPVGGTPRKVVFRPSERPDVAYIRYEKEWNGCRWRTVGSEPVADVQISGSMQGDTVVGP